MIRRNINERCTCKRPFMMYGSVDVYCMKCGCNAPLPDFFTNEYDQPKIVRKQNLKIYKSKEK